MPSFHTAAVRGEGHFFLHTLYFKNVALNATPLIQILDTILLGGGESSKGGKHCIVFNEYALNSEDSGVKTRDRDPSWPSR